MYFQYVQLAARIAQKLTPSVQQKDFNFSKVQDPQEPVKAVLSPLLPEPSHSPSTMAILIGVAAVVVALGLFLLLRNALFNYLIERRVPPSSANGASWAFYAFLAATAITAIAGFVVGLWSSIPFLAGGGTVSTASLIFFLVSYFGALRRAK